jgi:CBS domain-containing protein
MKASDIMTPDVVAVPPDIPVASLAAILIEHRISAVPVIDRGRLVGIVTENDLLRRIELGTQRTRPRWLHFLTSDDTLLAEYLKSRGQTAGDVMTSDVVTVDEDTPIADIADLLESRHIKRVPVLNADKIVGIISRANLIQALATYASAPNPSTAADDSTIREQLCHEMRSVGWGPEPVTNNMTVHDGIVHLWGFMTGDDERRAVLVAVRRVPGVKAVKDHRVDLLSPAPISEQPGVSAEKI